MSAFLKYEQQGHVVTLTMSQPERRNPLTGNTAIPEFLAAIDRIHGDRSVRCVILAVPLTVVGQTLIKQLVVYPADQAEGDAGASPASAAPPSEA